MDLGLLYGDFVMDNRELTLRTTADGSGVFRDVEGHTYCTIRPFRDADPDIERDPLSTNRRLFDSGGTELLGTMVVAGPTTDVIYVLVPDSHLHSGRDMSNRSSTCDRTEVRSGRKSDHFGHFAKRGSAPIIV